MQKQIEITEPCPLLAEDGVPAYPGYCRKNIYIYNKEKIRRHRCRIKEWDFYLITDGRYKVELNFFNISWIAALTATFTDLKTGETHTDLAAEPSTPDKFELSPAADAPHVFLYGNQGRACCFETDERGNRLLFTGRSKGRNFEMRIEGKRLPDQESLTILTPFKEKYCLG